MRPVNNSSFQAYPCLLCDHPHTCLPCQSVTSVQSTIVVPPLWSNIYWSTCQELLRSNPNKTSLHHQALNFIPPSSAQNSRPSRALNFITLSCLIHIYEPSILRDASTGSFSRLHSSKQTMDVWHQTHSIIFERCEGTIPLGIHTSGGSGGCFSSLWLPWAILHTPLRFPLHYWCGYAPRFILHNPSYLLGQHISILQSSYLLFATPTLSPPQESCCN